MKPIQLIIIFILTICCSTTVMSANDMSEAVDKHQHAGEHNHAEIQDADEQRANKSLTNDKLACEQSVSAKVNGLVCDFCARALEKVFSKQQAVAGIQVDLDAGLIDVQFKPGQSLDQGTLTQLITDSGYNVESYLPGCGDE